MNYLNKNIRWVKTFLTSILLAIVLVSCEKEIDIDIPENTPSLVVEGLIANGMQPLVVLSHNIPFVNESGVELYENSFVHNALVIITVNNNFTDTLTEQEMFNSESGITSYRFTSQNFTGEIGKSYQLTIKYGNHTYTASASIPEPVKITKIWFENHPKAENDSLKTIWVTINDPVGRNYYRYTSEVNGNHGPQPEISTLTDNAFDGKEYTKAIDSGLKNEEQDLHGGVSGYFVIGDTVTVKWANVEKSYYNAWSTIDFKRSQNQNPFLNPIRIVGNIKGCLGYWSGLGVDAQTIILK